MKSFVTNDFRYCFKLLPERIKRIARKNYKSWKENPSHPGLEFKQLNTNSKIYSIRVGIGWRACGIKESNTMVWFWIGSHEDYNNLLKKIK